VLDSVSRLQSKLSTPEESAHARKIREALALYRQSEDLINLGAYVGGANPKLDAAIRLRPQLLDFLKQDSATHSPFEETLTRLSDLAKLAG